MCTGHVVGKRELFGDFDFGGYMEYYRMGQSTPAGNAGVNAGNGIGGADDASQAVR